MSSGVLFAIIAMLGWGVADFLAQRLARKLGVAGSLFSGSIFGCIVLLPFVAKDFDRTISSPHSLFVLVVSVGVGLFAALFSLEAFRLGKLSVVEPIMGLELPLTIALAVLLRGERLGVIETAVMAAAFLGIVMTAIARPLGERFSKKTLEKGALLGLIGAIGLGGSNFMMGVASQDVSPVMAVWFGRAAFVLVFGLYLLYRGRVIAALKEARGSFSMILTVSTLYLIAFTSYATATTLIPISVATTISESYIVLTTVLGVFLNREKLRAHQFVGVGVVIASVFALTQFSS